MASMAFSFSDSDISRIATVLDASPKQEGDLVRFEIEDESSSRRIALEIHRGVRVSEEIVDETPLTLVSVYSPNSFLQLQNCSGFIASKELGEVIFFARQGERTNGLVVEREAGCSLYANVDDRLLSTDFTQLPPELIMSSVALSMTETIFDNMG